MIAPNETIYNKGNPFASPKPLMYIQAPHFYHRSDVYVPHSVGKRLWAKLESLPIPVPSIPHKVK